MSAAAPGRLRWRCRRGMKELDVLLGGFLEARWDALDGPDRARFVALLDEQDPHLYGWLTGHATHPDPAVRALLARIAADGGLPADG